MYNSPHSFPLFYRNNTIRVSDTSYIVYLNEGGRETCSRVRNPGNVPIVALAVFEADDKKTET